MELNDALYRLSFIRAFETVLLERVSDNGIRGTCHACVGQEATALAIASALRPGDIITSTHRGHGHYLARFQTQDSAVRLAAEIMGKSGGLCGGWGGTQHLQAQDFQSNGITGGMAPVAVGEAFDLVLPGEPRNGRIVVCFLGDGALAQGVVYEAMNFAALKRLPVLFVIENNGYAMSAPVKTTLAGPALTARAEALGIECIEKLVDDWRETESVAAQTIAMMRIEEPRPRMIIFDTYRFCGHSKSDNGEYRPAGEYELWESRDPVRRLIAELTASQGTEAVADILNRATADAADAFLTASRQPDAIPPATATEADTIAFAPYSGAKQTIPHQPPTGSNSDLCGLLIARALDELLAADPRVVLLGEDIEDPYGGAFRLTKGLSSRYPDQVFNTPISESAVCGIATGLALRGRFAVVESMFGDFVSLMVDQLINHAAKFRALFGGQATVPLTVRAPMGGRRGYGGTHSQTLEKHFLGAPGLKVVALSPWHDPGRLLIDSVFDPNPVLFIENKLLYGRKAVAADAESDGPFALRRLPGDGVYQIGRASWRERV